MIRRILALLVVAACGEDTPDDWRGVRNPVLADPDVAIKDAFAVRDDAGTWHLGFSEIHADPFRFVLGFATSDDDLATVARTASIDQPATGGLASPDVVRAPDGTYVMTYNSHTRDEGDALSKLYYRTSPDLTTWSEPQRIHIDGLDAPTDRLIDAALAFTNDDGIYLVFKRDQSAAIAHASSLAGPWTLLGDLDPASIENAQLFELDGAWHMLATTIPVTHEPTLYRRGADWRTWTKVATFAIPEQAWNSGEFLDHEVANAAYLVPPRDTDDARYLIYAGSSDLSSFEGRGHAKLGIARSRDLVSWEPAPER